MEIEPSYSAEAFARLVSREDRVERKTGLGQTPIQEAMVALSNSGGGVIFVGVKDDGTVVGRVHDQTVDDKIHEAALTARDVGRYRILEVDVEGRSVVAVQVDRRIEGFAQTSNGRILVRKGGRNTALFGADLSRFINERALRRFELTDTALSSEAIDDVALREVCEAFGWDPQGEDLLARLRERGLIAEGSGRLTVAGALFLTDPASSLRQNKAVVEVRRYPEGSVDYDRREVFGGPVHRQVVHTTNFVVDELGSDVVVTGLFRHDLPRLPEVVVREAIANAVAHRSYEAQGTAIVVELRPDEVVVTSPGGLPEPVTVENIRQAQAARNQVVIDALRRFRLAEDVGRGIDVIQDTMDDALLDPPRFEDLGNIVRVSLPLRGPITPRERAWVSELQAQDAIVGRDRLLLVHAARGERLTNSRTREVLSVDRVEARETLQRLRDLGLLRQHGRRGGATYTLVPEIAPPAAFRMGPEELETLLLAEAKRRPLTNEIVRNLTGLQRPQALAVLRGLVERGRLRKVGERRGTRYVLPD